MHAPAGRLRLERVERGEHLHVLRPEAHLLLGLAQRGREEVAVARLRPASGQAELATVAADVGAQQEQDPQHPVDVAEDGRQDGRVSERGRGQASARSRSASVSRRRISRAAPPPTRTAAGRVTPL